MVCSQSLVCILYCSNITSFSNGSNFKHAHPIFPGICQVFLSGCMYGEGRRAQGIKNRLRVVWKQGKLACAVCLKPRASKRLQFKPALRFLGLFAVDFLIRKHPWRSKVRYHEYSKETREKFRSFLRQLTLETELVVSSAMMVFWMALFARGRVIFPGPPTISWVEHVKHAEWCSKNEQAGDQEGNTSHVSKRTVRTTLFLFSVFIFSVTLPAVRISLLSKF